jgi:hypothetical protein
MSSKKSIKSTMSSKTKKGVSWRNTKNGKPLSTVKEYSINNGSSLRISSKKQRSYNNIDLKYKDLIENAKLNLNLFTANGNSIFTEEEKNIFFTIHSNDQLFNDLIETFETQTNLYYRINQLENTYKINGISNLLKKVNVRTHFLEVLGITPEKSKYILLKNITSVIPKRTIHRRTANEKIPTIKVNTNKKFGGYTFFTEEEKTIITKIAENEDLLNKLIDALKIKKTIHENIRLLEEEFFFHEGDIDSILRRCTTRFIFLQVLGIPPKEADKLIRAPKKTNL